MKNFMVAYISFFDNIMIMKKVQAENEVKAAVNYLQEQYGFVFENIESLTLDDVGTICFNSDSVIGVQEI